MRRERTTTPFGFKTFRYCGNCSILQRTGLERLLKENSRDSAWNLSGTQTKRRSMLRSTVFLSKKPRPCLMIRYLRPFPDPKHFVGESRYIIIGISRFGQLLVVAHTDRGEKIRIISARKATRQEKRFYEEGS